jgi:hypothetical protein
MVNYDRSFLRRVRLPGFATSPFRNMLGERFELSNVPVFRTGAFTG